MIKGSGSGSGSGGGGTSIAGVTQAWVNSNFVSIEFFNRLFTIHGTDDDDNDVVVVPNDNGTTISNIQAMFGTWTESFLTALGQNGSGGGGGGAETLDELNDVEITDLTNGQALVYNATMQKWVNQTISSGTDMTTVWTNLAASGAQQIDVSHLTSALSTALAGYATETWVGNQGFATQTWVNTNFITVAYFDRLFRAYNGSTLISHNDTTSTINSIKAMVGFWTDFYLTALGQNGGASSGVTLDLLSDVTITSPTSGQVLQYNGSEWVNASLTIATALSGLTDVLLTSVTAGQVLTYDGTSLKWVNTTLSLGSLSDVVLSSSATNQALIFNGTNWVNTTLKTVNGYSLIGSGNIDASGSSTGNYLPLAGGTMTGTIHYYNSYTGLYYLGTSNTPAGKIIHTAGGNKTIALISRDGDEGGILVGTDCTTIYGAGDGGYVFKVYDADGITDLSGGFPYNKCFLAIRENTGQLMCKDIYSQVENGENNFQIVGLNSSSIIRLMYDDNTYHQFCIYNSSSDFYIEAPNNKTFKIGFRGGSIPFYMTTSGNIGLGDSNPAYRLEVSGNCRVSSHLLVASTDTSYELCVGGTIYATGAITGLSDAREKQVVKNTTLSVEQLAAMPSVIYRWKDLRDKGELHVGTLAQDWQRVLPEVVLRANDAKGTLSMQYGVAALVSAITIARRVVDHERRIRDLETENKKLKEQLKIA